MKLYNTLTHQVENVVPADKNNVKVYTCGPTVYDYQHIGNWFTYIRYDLLIRALKLNGFIPNWVINITDVGHLTSDEDSGEDKLVAGAKRDQKTAWEVAEHYSADFLSGLDKLNVLKPSHIPRATQHIDDQIDLIKILESKGLTYVIDDGVYFDSLKFLDYVKLARLNLAQQQTGKRVGFNPQKRNASDFALWKFNPKNETRDMQWDSPWGSGFPGWHIECSAIILKYLGESIDIHCGGIDHISVHHTNEIAQSESATGKPLSKHWMHTNHILIDDDKISKSLGNGITLSDITKKGYELEALRLLCLESHYRTQSKFGWEELGAANARLRDFRAMAVLRWQTVDSDSDNQVSVDSLVNDITSNLNNDLNTPKILAAISHYSDLLRTSLIPTNQVQQFTQTLELIDNALGLTLFSQADISDNQKKLIKKRQSLRSSGAWAEADDIRLVLERQGILLNDTQSRSIWSRI